MAWYNTTGPLADTVISSRVRLARNINGYPFDSRLDASGANEIIEKVDFSSQKLVFLLNKTDICVVNKNVNVLNFIVTSLDNKSIKANLINSIDNSLGKGNISENTNKLAENILPIIAISAKTGDGISDLRTILAASQRDLLADSDTTLVTNQRHVQALTDARTSLLRVREGLASGLPSDLAAQDIREAIYHLGSIVGEISTDEVLGNIFRNFCIGK